MCKLINKISKSFLLIIFFIFFGYYNYVYANLDTKPLNKFWSNNGETRSIMLYNNKLYIGGKFDYIGPPTGNAVRLNSNNGSVIDGIPFPQSLKFNNNVLAVISDNNGGFYVAGEFTKIGNLTRNRIAHILPNGSVDPNFVVDINNKVTSLKLSSDGSILYIGGEFTSVNGQTRNRLAAVYTSTGQLVSSFNPDPDGNINNLEINSNGSILYVAGLFYNIGSQSRNGLVALDTSNGEIISSFNPDTNYQGYNVYSMKLSPDNNILYTSIYYYDSSLDLDVYFLKALNTSDGQEISSFNIQSDSSIYSLEIDSTGSTLYVGGSFTNIGGQPRQGIAAIDTSNGQVLSSFNPLIHIQQGIVRSLKLSNNQNILYIGGDFVMVNGVERRRIAALNTSDGSLNTQFNSNADNKIVSMDISSDNSILYVGGYFTSIGGFARNNIAVLDISTGEALSFNPNFNNTIFDMKISPDGSILYIGGEFTSVNGQTRNRLAAVYTSTGQLVSSFNPDSNGNINSLEIDSAGSTLYVGGSFTNIGGQPRQRIAAIDTSNGQVLSSFNPGADQNIYSLKFSPDNSILYVGGQFINIGGQSRTRFAALNPLDGSVLPLNLSIIGDRINSIEISNDGNIIYIGGNFTTVNSLTRKDIASFYATSSNVTNLISDTNGDFGTYVNSLKLSLDNTKLYIGGYFAEINNNARIHFAEVDANTGNLTSFNLNLIGNNIYDIEIDNNNLYIGGIFNAINNNPKTGLAVFSQSYPDISVYPNNINFGNININSSSTQSLIVENFGSADLIISSINSPSAPFSVISDNCSGQTISISNFCNINIKFNPINSGLFNSSLTINSNDPDQPNLTVNLTGNGINNTTTTTTTVDQQLSNGSVFKDELIPPIQGFSFKIKNSNNNTIFSKLVDLEIQGGNATWFQISNKPDFSEDSSSKIMNYSYIYKNWDICLGLSECKEGEYTIYVKLFNIKKNKSEIISSKLYYYPLIQEKKIIKNKINILKDFKFSKNLRFGMNNLDIKYLQILLNLNQDTKVANFGPGSPENETTYFGNLTRNAVIKFQEKYKDEILKPANVSRGTGFVGIYTIQKLNKLLEELMNY